MSLLGNDEIGQYVDICANHILKDGKLSTVEDKAAVALIKNILTNLNDIAYALSNIDQTYANKG